MLDEHVYVDDGISGAEFANRPGFLRLMNALKPRAPFRVLIMSEESRLGREAIETAYALKQLVQAGVRVFFYLEDRERTLDSPTDKIMLSLTAFADELEREKARQRTYDAMQRKARAGHVTGGRVFGYDNVEIVGADGQRSHVERRINEKEAAVVRQIFEMYTAGAGLTSSAKTLNAAGVRPQDRNEGGLLHGLRVRCAPFCCVLSIAARSFGTRPRNGTAGDRSGRQIAPRPSGSAWKHPISGSFPTSYGIRRKRNRLNVGRSTRAAIGHTVIRPICCLALLRAARCVAEGSPLTSAHTAST